MKEQIEKLEAQLKELKEVYKNEQKAKYEASEHKHFEKGDVVTNGDAVVVVEWTENKLIGCEYEKGYFGGSINLLPTVVASGRFNAVCHVLAI